MQRGFTLIELMIVVGIVAILAAVVVPAYQDQVVKTRRTEATVTLMRAAQDLERCFTRFSAYDDAGCAVATRLGTGIDSEEGHYAITGNVTATTYTLTATPQGAQAARDTDCADFTLTETGQKGVSGSESDITKCW